MLSSLGIGLGPGNLVLDVDIFGIDVLAVLRRTSSLPFPCHAFRFGERLLLPELLAFKLGLVFELRLAFELGLTFQLGLTLALLACRLLATDAFLLGGLADACRFLI